MAKNEKLLQIILKNQSSINNIQENIKDILKMLRAVANAQSSLKQELLKEIRKNRDEVKTNRDEIKKTNKRIDALGKDIAFVEDDAPTREEHDDLEKRVTKLEHQVL